VYAHNPDAFNVFQNEDFLWFLTKNVNSNKLQDMECACNAFFFLFQRKQCLVDFFAASLGNLELLKKWLTFGGDHDLKEPFMASLN